jgi:hypothetical protein
MFYADPAARATVPGRPPPAVGYFPIFPSSCASSGSAW